MKKTHLLTTLLLLASLACASAQHIRHGYENEYRGGKNHRKNDKYYDYRDNRPRFLWQLDLDMWFDNREYKSEFSEDMTLFGLRAVPEIGVGWWHHGIMLGTTVTADFGDPNYRRKPELILYYRYDDGRFAAKAGIFPRNRSIADYPRVMFSDSTRYYDSNLEGFMLQYRGRLGYVEAALDWLGMISENQRERFVIFSAGRIATSDKRFFAGYYASMFHHSVSYTEDGVVDNLLFYPYAGFRFACGKHHKFQMIELTAGWIQAMQRDRINENKWEDPGGFQARLIAEKWSIGIDNTFYAGKNLMPLYNRYGYGLYQGDPFYRTDKDFYNRLEIYWNPVRNRDMDLKIGAVFHYDGSRWDSQQLVTFSINLTKETFKR